VAHRELDEAATWFRAANERGVVKLLQGLAADDGSGEGLLREAMAELGGPLVGGFHLLVEGKRTRYRPALKPGELLRHAGGDLAAAPSVPDLVALAHALDAAAEGDRAVGGALAALRGMLERAAQTLQLGESDDLLICEALHRHGQTQLTSRFAKAALERWPERPVFVYLDAAARFGDTPWRMSDLEWERLDEAYEQASAQGDRRTASRIDELLGDHPEADGPFDDAHSDDPEALGPESLQAVMDVMLAEGGVERFLATARQELGKAEYDRMRREFEGTDKEFARAMLDVLLPPGPGAAPGPGPTPPARAKLPQRPPSRSSSPATVHQPDLFDE
jgi:cellulose synthase operon protein C